MGITKTDYTRGMQCPKMLWLDKHKPEKRIISQEMQAILDGGNEFGDKAMAMFGDYVETTTLKANGYLDISKMIEKTRECISSGVRVICEAAFSFCRNYCAVDILKKEFNGYEIYEVKNCPSVEEQFIRDVGFQRYIVEKSGVVVTKCFIVYHGNDKANPFIIQDVTERAKSYYYEVDDNIWRLDAIKSQQDEPDTSLGDQCLYPYKCWYKEYCESERKKTLI